MDFFGGIHMERKNITKMFLSVLTVILGNILYALAVKLFLLPAGLVTGGTTGIALAVQQVADIPISVFVLVFNVVMLIVGFAALGKQFAFTTVISTFTYPIALNALDHLLGEIVLTEDIMICTVFSGLGIGLALGIVIRAGASTGGMDIPPLVLNRYFKIPVSASLYIFDLIILLAQAYFQPVEKLLYGIVLVIIYTITLDRLLLMGTTRTEVRVISSHAQEICDEILKRLDRGVTLLSARGGYTKEETSVLFSVISNRELPRVERIIHDIDPESFMVVNRVSEVSGKGFTLKKEYK